jgi:hypothetical protein
MIIDGPRMYAFYKPDYQIYFASFIMAAALYGLGGGKHSLDEKTKKKD